MSQLILQYDAHPSSIATKRKLGALIGTSSNNSSLLRAAHLKNLTRKKPLRCSRQPSSLPGLPSRPRSLTIKSPICLPQFSCASKKSSNSCRLIRKALGNEPILRPLEQLLIPALRLCIRQTREFAVNKTVIYINRARRTLHFQTRLSRVGVTTRP